MIHARIAALLTAACRGARTPTCIGRLASTNASATLNEKGIVSFERWLRGKAFTVLNVCYNCLKVLQASSGPIETSSKHRYCSPACQHSAQGGFIPVELAAHLQPLWDSCKASGERFPLLAARLACLRISTELATAAGRTPTTPLALIDLQHLCHVNVPHPPPQPWAETYELLHASFDPLHHASHPGLSQAAKAITLDWYSSILSRLHINSFKVDAILPFHWGDMHAVAAAVVAQAPGSYSGSAVYVLASLFNHSCEPNIDITYPGNDATATFTAARDIAPGEQLCISYIDTQLPVLTRQETLAWSYGFACRCERCREELGRA